jgi:hypothetical protein
MNAARDMVIETGTRSSIRATPGARRAVGAWPRARRDRPGARQVKSDSTRQKTIDDLKTDNTILHQKKGGDPQMAKKAKKAAKKTKKTTKKK